MAKVYPILLNMASLLIGCLALTESTLAKNPCCATPLQGEVDSKLITVMGELSGKKHRFVLDSGTPHHVFDHRLVPFLVGDPRTHAANALNATIYPPQAISFSGVQDRRKKEIAVSDLSSIESALDVEISGILGVPFFEDRVVVLDFDARRITVDDNSSNLSEVTLSMSQDRRHVRFIPGIQIADVPILMALDTGFTGALTVTPEVFDDLDLLGVLSEHCIARKQTYEGTKTDRAARVSVVQVGKYQLTDVPIYESEFNAIGIQLLRNFKTTIDFHQNKLGLTANANFNRYLEIDGRRPEKVAAKPLETDIQ